MNRHPPRDLAHRGQQRQAAVVSLDRLVRHRHDPAAARRFKQRAIRRKMEIGKHHLAAPESTKFARLRFFHFHDQLRPPIQRGRGRHDPCAHRPVIAVRGAAPVAGAALDQDRVPGVGERLAVHRQQSNAVLVRLDLPGHADDHGSTASGEAARFGQGPAGWFAWG